MKITQSEISKRVEYIASLIAKYNPELAQCYINDPFHRDQIVASFDAGFDGYNAITTEVICLNIDLQNDIRFGK